MESQQAEGTVRTRLDDTTALDRSGRVVGKQEVIQFLHVCPVCPSSRRNPLTYLTKPYDHLLTPTRCNPYLGNHRFRVASGVWYAWWVRAF